MVGRCPECAAELPDDAGRVCPRCGYSLQTPAVSKVGVGIMFLGLLLLGGYLLGPENLGLRSGWMPADLADLAIANFGLLLVGTFLLGMLLVAAGALKARAERAAVAA
ncbi:MAG: hypothetical protein A3K68_06635 [Euryarchaeota archaeon RBG_16_68_13]|nr:MAG: hypothetical protein A3K68_06635 [Euryarchaeota archaeon RBG_16_68_13]